MNKQSELFGHIAILSTVLIWSFNFVVVKVSLTELSPFVFNASRYIAAGLFMLLLRKLRNIAPLILENNEKKRFWWLVAMGHIGYQLLFIVGLNLTYASHAAVMLGTIPLQVGIYAHFRSEEKLNRKLLIALLMAFSGVLFMSLQKNATGIDLQVLLGDILLVLGGFMWASFTVELKPLLKTHQNIALNARLIGIGTAGLILAATPEFMSFQVSDTSFLGWVGVLYSGVLSIGVAYLGWNRGVRTIGAVKTAYYQNLVPVLGVVWGVLIMGDTFGGFQIVGMTLVLLGIFAARKG